MASTSAGARGVTRSIQEREEARTWVQIANPGLLGPVPVKGLATPIEIFELTGASPVRGQLHAAASRE
jgi:hypothetical protein